MGGQRGVAAVWVSYTERCALPGCRLLVLARPLAGRECLSFNLLANVMKKKKASKQQKADVWSAAGWQRRSHSLNMKS